jgi:hypothetical protein
MAADEWVKANARATSDDPTARIDLNGLLRRFQ